MAEIIPYPHKNCLDVLLVGQEDEATVDTDEHKWDEDGDASIMGAADEADDGIRDFDPNDWVHGEEAAVTPAVAADTDAQHHGDGGAVSEIWRPWTTRRLTWRLNIDSCDSLRSPMAFLKEWKVQWGLLCVTLLPQ